MEYEVGHYTYNGNIPVALSPSGVVQITAPEYVRDGQVTLNLGVESEVRKGALGIEVEGDVQLSLAFEFTVDFYPGIPIQEDLTGEVTIFMGLSSEVALITPAMLDLDGGVGIGEDLGSILSALRSWPLISPVVWLPGVPSSSTSLRSSPMTMPSPVASRWAVNRLSPFSIPQPLSRQSLP